MKRILLPLFLFLLSFVLCACDPGTTRADAGPMKDIAAIELIEYNNPEQKKFSSWVPDHSGKLLAFDESRVSVIETLQEDKIEDFLDSLAEKEVLSDYYCYDSPTDVCIRIRYSDGHFMILWTNYKQNSYKGYIGEYARDGSVLSFLGTFSSLQFYQELVNNFFDYSI